MDEYVVWFHVEPFTFAPKTRDRVLNGGHGIVLKIGIFDVTETFRWCVTHDNAMALKVSSPSSLTQPV